jgi:hypothetical protein
MRGWTSPIIATCIAQRDRLEHRFYRSAFAPPLGPDHPIGEAGKRCKTARSGLHDDASAVALIRHPDGKTQSRQGVERPAHGRFAQTQRLGKTPYSVGTRIKRYAKKYRRLSGVEVGPVGPNGFSEHILEKGKRGSTVHKQLRFASPARRVARFFALCKENSSGPG